MTAVGKKREIVEVSDDDNDQGSAQKKRARVGSPAKLRQKSAMSKADHHPKQTEPAVNPVQDVREQLLPPKASKVIARIINNLSKDDLGNLQAIGVGLFDSVIPRLSPEAFKAFKELVDSWEVRLDDNQEASEEMDEQSDQASEGSDTSEGVQEETEEEDDD